MDLIDTTLKLWRSMPFEWGGRLPHVPGVGDCLLSIGDYIASAGHTDVSSRFRGTYDDEAGASAHIASNGGVVGLIDLAGLRSIDPPDLRRGDVVVLDTGEAEVGGLFTGNGVAARLERGVIEINPRFVRLVKVWAING